MIDLKLTLWLTVAIAIVAALVRTAIRDGRAAYRRSIETDLFPLAKNPAPLEPRSWGPAKSEESR